MPNIMDLLDRATSRVGREERASGSEDVVTAEPAGSESPASPAPREETRPPLPADAPPERVRYGGAAKLRRLVAEMDFTPVYEGLKGGVDELVKKAVATVERDAAARVREPEELRIRLQSAVRRMAYYAAVNACAEAAGRFEALAEKEPEPWPETFTEEDDG